VGLNGTRRQRREYETRPMVRVVARPAEWQSGVALILERVVWRSETELRTRPEPVEQPLDRATRRCLVDWSGDVYEEEPGRSPCWDALVRQSDSEVPGLGPA